MMALLSRIFIAVALRPLLLNTMANAALPVYYFADFEADGGWKVGRVPTEKAPVQLVQGDAAIAVRPEKDSQQVLALGPSNPFPAVFVDTLPIARASVVFCELLARPSPVAETADAEFFDFGGAILGFFRVGRQGEIRALYNRSGRESVWISTGARFELNEDELPADWLRILVRLDRRTGRWDLRVNSVPLLSGLSAIKGEAAGLAFWLYGQEAHECLFDDLLLTTVEPDHLNKLLSWHRVREARSSALARMGEGPKKVMRAKASTELRNAQPAIQKAERELITPILRDWNEMLQIGNNIYKSGQETVINGRRASLMPYALRRDDEGRPLPGVITITADSELQPGTDLSRIRWLHAEVKKWPDQLGEVFATGDFRTGLVQTIQVPGRWLEKFSVTYVWAQPGRLDPLWSGSKVARDTISSPQQ